MAMKTNLLLRAYKTFHIHPSFYFIVALFFSALNSYAQCTKTWYRDLDNDGFGDPTNTQISCTLSLTGYVLNGIDCNDNYPNTSIRKQISGLSASKSIATQIVIGSDGQAVVLYSYNNISLPQTWTVKRYNGSSWITLGLDPIPSPSNAEVNETSLALDPNGVPYIFFGDGSLGDYRTTVLKYNLNSNTWDIVGTDRFALLTQGSKKSIKFDNNGVLHIAFTGPGGGVNVMKYDGTVWQTVGSSDFGAAASTPGVSLSFDNNNIPYVTFAEEIDLKATVMKFDGTDWVDVGLRAFSDGYDIGLPTIDFNSSNIPYIAYFDNIGEVVVQQFISGAWQKVGNTAVGTTFKLQSVSFAIDLTDVPVMAYVGDADQIEVKKLDAANNWFNTDTNTNVGENVSLSIGPDNTPYVTFQDFANGDFAVAQSVAPNEVSAAIPVATTTTSTICRGESTTLEVTGNLNDATRWVWYAGGCGNGTSIGHGTSLLVSPTTTTTYFVRGEGICSTATGLCASITITV
ncbi:MAG: hypothetical protein EBR30_28400, partial [Cytophagia bacterium]|nr:hypothetical protein [Cytophagia bacterium]NBW38867.1 hypothetical protein [Cytophagia bacterium]